MRTIGQRRRLGRILAVPVTDLETRRHRRTRGAVAYPIGVAVEGARATSDRDDEEGAPPTMASVVLQVPRRAQSLIIGKGRKTITEIMQDTGTEIYVPARKQQSSEITIKGPTGQAVKDAQERIEHILGYELDEEELTVAYFGVPKVRTSFAMCPVVVDLSWHSLNTLH